MSKPLLFSIQPRPFSSLVCSLLFPLPSSHVLISWPPFLTQIPRAPYTYRPSHFLTPQMIFVISIGPLRAKFNMVCALSSLCILTVHSICAHSFGPPSWVTRVSFPANGIRRTACSRIQGSPTIHVELIRVSSLPMK